LIKSYLKALKAGLQEPIPLWELPVLLAIAVIDFTVGLGWLRYLFIAAVVWSLVTGAKKRQ